MHILKVKKYSGTNMIILDSEAEALHRMELWARHPEFISAEVRKVQIVTPIVYSRRGTCGLR